MMTYGETKQSVPTMHTVDLLGLRGEILDLNPDHPGEADLLRFVNSTLVERGALVEARNLEVGDFVDAQRYLAKYAEGTADHLASESQLLYVEHVEQETADCTRIGMGSDHYGVPSDWLFPVERT